MDKEIILTRNFPKSGYLQQGNIGHEIINLLKTDNGDNYIYLLPGGDYAHKHSENEIEAVLLTRGVSQNCVEVLAKATGITPIFKPDTNWKGATDNEFQEMGKLINEKGIDNITKNDNVKMFYKSGKRKDQQYNKRLGHKIIQYKDVHDNQLKTIKNNKITYGDINLNELFTDNTTDKFGLSIYLTFKADKVVLAKEPFYLHVDDNKTTENDLKIEGRHRLAGSALTTYYEKDKDSTNYNNLVNLINNPDLWGEETKKYQEPANIEDDFTFLTLTGKEYDELSFSNMFAYYFDKYTSLLKCFVEKIQDEDGNKPCEFVEFKGCPEICREEEEIDILIKTNHPIIIENKIKSEINGKKHDIHGQLVGTQLKKYYDYVQKKYGEPICLIFSPNYNNINTEKIMRNEREKYKIIKYDKIYDVLNNYYEENKQEFADDKYFVDFLKAIKYHSVENDNRFEEISTRKMKKLIDKAKNKS